MTNTEAIKLLSQIRDALLASNSWLPSTDNPIKESFGMAINALKAQEQLANDSPELDSDSGDLISRDAALKACYNGWNKDYREIAQDIKDLPSAQPETHEERTETHACDCISRQAAIEAIRASTQKYTGFMEMEMYTDDDAVEAIINLPSAQPEHTNSCYTNSWCIDCKEYDTENKCCPRYNRVIKQTLDDAYRHGETEAESRFHAQQRWIPCSERLPEHRLYVLVTYKYEYGLIDNGITWYSETENKWNTSREVIAWMPLPEPYREEGD